MNQLKSSPTIRDVARLAGVSVATISRYLNHSAPLAADTAKRVEAAMEQLQFIPHPAARNLATNRTMTVGLVLNEIGGDFFTPLLEGVITTTESAGYNLLIFTSNHPHHPGSRLLSPHYTDGLMVFLESVPSQDLTALRQSGQPVVLIHQSSPEGLGIPTVTIENKAASRRIVTHLIEVHHRRRIVFLKGPEGNEDSTWRETGYREALDSHSLPFLPELITRGDFDRFTARQSILELVQRGVEFDGVFTGDDDAAIGALQALKESGLRVPDQVSVVGFDDQRLAPFLSPPLTTVHAPTDLVGAETARQLLQMINGGKVEEVTLLPTELVIRESCGCSQG